MNEKLPANKMNVLDIVGAISRGEMKCETLVRACIDRISERESTVGAWAFVDPEDAITRACDIDRRRTIAPFHGLPVGVKDVIASAGLPTQYGSPIYAGQYAQSDASCISLFEELGGMMLGKTVTTEFATRHPDKTRNPHNPEHTPGGSSSGSAAAVADFMVPVAFGTQTTGSHIRPASYCGIVGYKPTFGVINRTGLKPLSDSQDTIGVYTRCVEDAAFVVQELSSLDLLKPAMDVAESSLRIGVCRTPYWDRAQAETAEALEVARKLMEALGDRVVDIDFPERFQDIGEIQETINDFESWRALAYERTRFPDKLTDTLRRKLEKGSRRTREEYEVAKKRAGECREIIDSLFSRIDVIIAPSAPGEAPKGLDYTGDPIFSQAWTILHVPAVNVPVHHGPNNLPVGVQMTSGRGRDHVALGASMRLQRARR